MINILFYLIEDVIVFLIGIIRFADDPKWGDSQKNPDVFDICHFPFKDQLCRFRIIRSADDPLLGAAQKSIPRCFAAWSFSFLNPSKVT